MKENVTFSLGNIALIDKVEDYLNGYLGFHTYLEVKERICSSLGYRFIISFMAAGGSIFLGPFGSSSSSFPLFLLFFSSCFGRSSSPLTISTFFALLS